MDRERHLREPGRAWEAPGFDREDPPHGPNYGPGWRYTHEPRFAYAEEYASSYGYGRPEGRPWNRPGRPRVNERVALEREAAQLRERLYHIERRLNELSAPRR